MRRYSPIQGGRCMCCREECREPFTSAPIRDWRRSLKSAEAGREKESAAICAAPSVLGGLGLLEGKAGRMLSGL